MRLNTSTTIIALLVIIMITACSGPKRDDDGNITGEGSMSAFDIAVGDCFNTDTSADVVSDVGAVPCTDPHDSEAFYLINYPAGNDEDFPVQADLDSFSDDQCVTQFESYVGVPYADSKYYVSYLQPTAESWEQDDREVVCLVVGEDGEKLTDSVKGTAE